MSSSNETLVRLAKTAGRTCPLSTPADWQPPVPAWSAQLPVHAATAALGVQDRGGAALALLNAALTKVLSGGHAPAIVERTQYLDSSGYDTAVAILYWRSLADFSRWLDGPFNAWWFAPERTEGAAGYFIEAFSMPRHRTETIFSAPDFRAGAGEMEEGRVGPILEHNYWGAMRDRLEVASNDPLSALLSQRVIVGSPERSRVRVVAPPNLCIIRSGQDWALCEQDEREEYFAAVYPALTTGMRYLSEHPDESGCYSCRFMSHVDPDGQSLPRTFGLACFGSLEHLERWARSHPTHLEIFGRFIKLATRMGPAMRLRLWHEVCVLGPEGLSRFEYANCHAATGLLPYRDLSEQ